MSHLPKSDGEGQQIVISYESIHSSPLNALSKMEGSSADCGASLWDCAASRRDSFSPLADCCSSSALAYHTRATISVLAMPEE